MIYFYHHYELPYVVQQNQLQQVILQRQQEQHQHHHHQFANGAGRGGGGGAAAAGAGGTGRGGGDGRRGTDGRVPTALHRRNNAFNIMNGLQHLARFRATLLRRRRVRLFDNAAPQPPMPTAQVIPDETIPNAGAPVDVSDGGAVRQDGTVPVVQQ